MRALPIIAAITLVTGCEEPIESVAPLYEAAPVEVRAIDVSVDAAGVIEPEITVEVKSKASGEILAMHAETGDLVEAGALVVEIDKRTPRNRLAEAEAALVAARARRAIAESQMERAETLFESGTFTESEYEQSQLEFANAQAQVISSEVALENSRIAMDDTDVRSPITGTVIERRVEVGTVISSSTQNVSGGTVLLKMADLSVVQVRTLVDETDIGKIRPGMPTRVVVAAYPNQPFDGEVLKIEPQAIVEQNVTMFAVLIRLDNRGDLLKPGMNAEVEIQIATRDSAAVIPTMALRADSDIPVAAIMLGLDEGELRAELGRDADGANPSTSAPPTINLGGREIELPPGIDESRLQAIIAKRRSGEELTPEERAIAQQVFREQGSGARTSGGPQQFPRGNFGGGMGGGFGEAFGGTTGGRGAGEVARQPSVTEYQFGGDYWVVALRGGQPVPVSVRTGLTDLEYSEIVEGLQPTDEVLLLPSSSLFEQQEMLQQFISDRFSSTPFQSGRR